MVTDGDPLNSDEIHAAYVFDLVYDSTSVIIYTFTECTQNKNRIKLARWIEGRTVNADANLLSFNSTTESFLCHTGDSISFYREIDWRDPRTGWVDTNTYYALDSLDYTVELIRTSDSLRIALLDSIGLLPSFTPSRPVIHGTRPIMSLIHYIIPQSLNNTNAFIRVRVYHRGNGEYWFTRHDYINIALSSRLSDPNFIDFIKIFSPGSSKIAISDHRSLPGENQHLIVESIIGSPHDIKITFDGTSDGSGTAVVVYDMRGELIFIPYMTPGSSDRSQTTYHFGHSGTYFIGLLHNNRITALRKIIIN